MQLEQQLLSAVTMHAHYTTITAQHSTGQHSTAQRNTGDYAALSSSSMAREVMHAMP